MTFTNLKAIKMSVEIDIDKLASILQGTCMSLDGGLQDLLDDGNADEDILSTQHRSELDNLVFLCPQCGWWCETSEANESDTGEDLCDDCTEENNEEE
jgi:hypothetical protein